MPTKKENLLDLLKQAIKGEMRVSIQYMWQHILMVGVEGFAVKDQFKIIAMQEMKHSEIIAEHLNYLGEKPPNEPDPIQPGLTLEEMLKIDKKAEEDTIILYKKIIIMARKQTDFGTEGIFIKILQDEEAHLDFFITILEDDMFKL